LLVIEVADASLRYDRGHKARLFAQFGIRELWSIDAVKMTTRVFRDPSPEGYSPPRDYKAAETVKPQFAPEALALRLDTLKLV
jgi:Uma2 family endonuclease